MHVELQLKQANISRIIKRPNDRHCEHCKFKSTHFLHHFFTGNWICSFFLRNKTKEFFTTNQFELYLINCLVHVMFDSPHTGFPILKMRNLKFLLPFDPSYCLKMMRVNVCVLCWAVLLVSEANKSRGRWRFPTRPCQVVRSCFIASLPHFHTFQAQQFIICIFIIIVMEK